MAIDYSTRYARPEDYLALMQAFRTIPEVRDIWRGESGWRQDAGGEPARNPARVALAHHILRRNGYGVTPGTRRSYHFTRPGHRLP